MPSRPHTTHTKYLYEEIRDEILRRIEGGTYGIGDRLPSTRTLVEEFATTPVTVNRALSDLVDSGHVTRVAKSGSFVNAKDDWNGNRRRRTGLVGIVAFDMNVSVYWTQTVEAMQEALEARSMHAVIGYSGHSFEKAHAYIDDLVDKGIDGMIYVPIDAPDGETYRRENLAVCRHIEDRGIPFVLFDRRLPENRFPSVTADVHAAGLELMQHLSAAGSSHPVCVTVEYSQAIYERESAFVNALQDSGIETAQSRIVRFPGPRVYPSDLGKLRELIETAPNFDGLLLANSNIYSAFLKIEAELGRRWDVPIVTFRDLETDQPERPVARALQPVRRFGSVAGDLLGRLIEGDLPGAEDGAYPHIVLPVPIETA